MVWFLWEKCGDIVSKATVSRTLKREAWSKKKAQRIAHNISHDLRKDYLTSMAGIRAEQMVFLNGYRVDQLYAFKRVGSRFSSKFENPQPSSSWPPDADHSPASFAPPSAFEHVSHDLL